MSAQEPTRAPVPPLGAAVLDAGGVILAADDAFARLAGRDGPALRGRSFFAELGAVGTMRERGFYPVAPGGPADSDFTAPVFGATRGEFRVRVRSFDAGAGRCALVVVEQAGELERLRAAESAHARALSVISHARHEINNSLMGILAHLEILLAQAGIPEPIRRRAEILVQETEKIRDRVADLETIRRI